jgi:hypothetical protein
MAGSTSVLPLGKVQNTFRKLLRIFVTGATAEGQYFFTHHTLTLNRILDDTIKPVNLDGKHSTQSGGARNVPNFCKEE